MAAATTLLSLLLIIGAWECVSAELSTTRIQAKVEASIKAFATKCNDNEVRLKCDGKVHNAWFLCCSGGGCEYVDVSAIKTRSAFLNEACSDHEGLQDKGACSGHVNGVLDDYTMLGFTPEEKNDCRGGGYSFNRIVTRMYIKRGNNGAKQFADKFL